MPREPQPPQKLVIQKLSTGEQGHSPALRDDFTGEEITSALPTLGELPSTTELNADHAHRAAVDRALVEALIEKGQRAKLGELQRRGKAPFPRRDFTPQACAERGFAFIKSQQKPRRNGR